MTDTPEQKTVTLDDIKTFAQLRDVVVQGEQQRMNWAQQRVNETGYPQAVQTELALHRGDIHSFALQGLFDLLIQQEAQITALTIRVNTLLGGAK